MLQARRLLLFEPRDAAAIAFTVGYESASQFSREYARIFGMPPVGDMGRFKIPAGSTPGYFDRRVAWHARVKSKSRQYCVEAGGRVGIVALKLAALDGIGVIGGGVRTHGKHFLTFLAMLHQDDRRVHCGEASSGSGVRHCSSSPLPNRQITPRQVQGIHQAVMEGCPVIEVEAMQ